jgi:hypothetical protein
MLSSYGGMSYRVNGTLLPSSYAYTSTSATSTSNYSGGLLRKMDGITDGTSNTLLIGEGLAGCKVAASTTSTTPSYTRANASNSA